MAGSGERTAAVERSVLGAAAKPGSGAERSTDVLHEENEVEVVGGARLELGHHVQVEGSGTSGLGVHEEATAADVPGQCGEAGEDVLEQTRTESPPFMVDVDGEASEQSDRQGSAATPLTKPLRSVGATDLRHAPGVVGDDLLAVVSGDHEHLGGSGRGRLAGEAAKPLALLG